MQTALPDGNVSYKFEHDMEFLSSVPTYVTYNRRTNFLLLLIDVVKDTIEINCKNNRSQLHSNLNIFSIVKDLIIMEWIQKCPFSTTSTRVAYKHVLYEVYLNTNFIGYYTKY